jgi:hypothetical protein
MSVAKTNNPVGATCRPPLRKSCPNYALYERTECMY